MNCLYLIAHPQGWCKVGRAVDPVRRLGQHQAHSGERLSGVAIFPTDDSHADERRALTALRPDRVMGEWFLLSCDAAIAGIEAATGLKAAPFPVEAHQKPGRAVWVGPFGRLYRRLSQADPSLTPARLNRLLADDLGIWIEEAVHLERRAGLLADTNWLTWLRQSFLKNAEACERRMGLLDIRRED